MVIFKGLGSRYRKGFETLFVEKFFRLIFIDISPKPQSDY
ncbi:MAG: hypothetical protein JWR14_3678 [Caballeronia sp.]|jgi:hypothetical protein|nr:hypothetical protein [Caballeronia sp.]